MFAISGILMPAPYYLIQISYIIKLTRPPHYRDIVANNKHADLFHMQAQQVELDLDMRI